MTQPEPGRAQTPLAIRQLDKTGRSYEVRLFVLNIVILLSWYFATMAIPGHYRWYLLGSAFFFAAKTIWEHVAHGTRGLRLFSV